MFDIRYLMDIRMDRPQRSIRPQAVWRQRPLSASSLREPHTTALACPTGSKATALPVFAEDKGVILIRGIFPRKKIVPYLASYFHPQIDEGLREDVHCGAVGN